jgi:hypothetical protein
LRGYGKLYVPILAAATPYFQAPVLPDSGMNLIGRPQKENFKAHQTWFIAFRIDNERLNISTI